MWRYTKSALRHFLRPSGTRALPEISISGESRSGIAGEQLRLDLQLDDRAIIRDAAFVAPGSAGSIASTSALIGMIQNRHIAFAASLSERQLAEQLGELPESRTNSPVLGLEALHDAHRRWQSELEKLGVDLGEDAEVAGGFPLEGSERRICFCLKVSEGEIRRAIREGRLATVEQVSRATQAGTGCRSCHPDLAALLNEVGKLMSEREAERAKRGARLASASGGAPAAKRIDSDGVAVRDSVVRELIEDVIESEIRPKLALDGGGVEIVSFEAGVLTLRMEGACQSCASVSSTLNVFVQSTLRELVDPGLEVRAEPRASTMGNTT